MIALWMILGGYLTVAVLFCLIVVWLDSTYREADWREGIKLGLAWPWILATFVWHLWRSGR